MNLKQFTFNAYAENTYVLSDETKQCIIIDPGCYDQAEKDILADYISNENLEPVHLVNTHCHIDHVLGNKFVAEKYQLKLVAHKLEEPVLASVVNYGPSMGFIVEPSPPIEVFIDESQKLQFGNTTLAVLFTPGHSPGSVCFYHKAGNTLIGGDVLFQMSIGRTDLPGGDFETLMNSIQQKLWQLPNETVVYPGHGPSTNIAFEKANNPFLQ